jgi:polar amino acid transport system substrate-binding protein
MTRAIPGLLLGIMLTLLMPWPCLAQETPLKVAYLERPPYYWTNGEEPNGFLLQLTRQILDRAEVPATFAALPPNRILDELRQNTSPFCSIGWFKTSERETFATFSLPIYRDKPLVVLTLKTSLHRFSTYRTVRQLFGDLDLIMAQMASFSYGEALDRLRNQSLGPTMTISTSQSVLPRLIAQGRASYMLVAPEEIPTLLDSAGVNADLFATLPMDDVPVGNLRHLMFSKNVPETVLNRINAGIAELTNQDSLVGPDQL